MARKRGRAVTLVQELGTVSKVAAAPDTLRQPIRLLTFSTLYPNLERPAHGIFVENRLRQLVADGGANSTVLAPVPWFPLRSPRFGDWARHAAVPQKENRYGLDVYHPRYVAIPRIGMSVAPLLLYRAAAAALEKLVAGGLQFDLIDAHYLYPDGVAAVWLGRHFGKPVVVTARGSDTSLLPRYRVPRRLIQEAIADADSLISVSAGLKDGLVALGASADKVTILRNGVDLEAFRPVADREAARSKLGLGKGPLLLSAGHLIKRKGHNHIIEALGMLPGHTLLVIGEGPERGALQALARRLGVADRVRLLGAFPPQQMPLYYTAADVLVLASSREGWANVLLESMACGTPVIASPAWGSREAVRAPEAGLVLDKVTAEAIADGVRHLLAAPPAREATRRYAERFGWEETTAGQLTVFRRVLGRLQ